MHAPPGVEEILAGLNDEQRAAVTAPPDGHLLVLAGAGCGKTTVLTRRVAYLLSSGIAPGQILALTFTRKAAEEMGERLRRQNPGVIPLTTTFHGFGLRVLRERIDGTVNAARIGFGAEPRLLDEPERLALIAGVSTADQRAALGTDLLRLDALLEQRAVHPGKLAHLSAERRGILDGIAARLAAAKRQRGAWEFADMIDGALELLRGSPAIAARYAARYRSVLVDEFQDTNPLQIELLRMLLAQGAALFAVGDDDQAIYAFRGADTGPTLRFAGMFPGARICKLQTNYRSTPAILGAANRIFRRKDPAYRKVLRCGRTGGAGTGGRPRKRRFRELDAMIDWVSRDIGRLHARHGVDPATAALLFRLNRTLEQARERYQARHPRGPLPRFLTVHGAKGLEFPAVFLCDLEEGEFPSYRAGRPRGLVQRVKRSLGVRTTPADCDIEEERRLFYVGVTRAQRFLCLVSLNCKMHFNRTMRLEPSRFLRLV